MSAIKPPPSSLRQILIGEGNPTELPPGQVPEELPPKIFPDETPPQQFPGDVPTHTPDETPPGIVPPELPSIQRPRSRNTASTPNILAAVLFGPISRTPPAAPTV